MMKGKYQNACILGLVVCSSSRLRVISQSYRRKITYYAMFRDVNMKYKKLL